MICLLTDFGLNDVFVGIIKGVIYKIAPDSTIVDLSHSIEPFNIRQSSFLLEQSFKYFPAKTIFIVVTDPTVGSERESIVSKIDNKYVICPNNGILTNLMSNHKTQSAKIINDKYSISKKSNTFLGRDVFAPFAANLRNNFDIMNDLEDLELNKIINYPEYFPIQLDNSIIGEIVHIDRFGNLITNIESDNHIKGFKYKFFEFPNISNTFSDVVVGSPLIYIGSSGYYEIAINTQNAKKYFSAKMGDKITAFY